MRNNTPPKKKMIGTSAKGLVAQSRAEAARANAAKVAANAAKVAANAKKVKANAASVKANATAKATPKVTPKVTTTKPLVNNKVKTATAVATPNYTTSGKSYVVWGGKKGRTEMYGTQAQQDSTYAADNLWNDISRKNKGVNVSGTPTRQGYLKDPSKFKAFTAKQIAELPEYKAPGNTGAGALLKKSSVAKAAGYGGCQAGFRVDSQGNCVRIRGYVQQ